MEKAIEKIINISIELQELFAFISGFVQNDELNSQIKSSIFIKKPTDFASIKLALDLLYKGIEIMAFVMSEKENSAANIVDSTYTKTIKLGIYLQKLDSLANELYRMAKKNPELETKNEKQIRKTTDIEKIYSKLNINSGVFGYLNPEFMLPTEEIYNKDNLPKDAIIVNIKVENTINIVSTVQSIVDKEYVKKTYPNLTSISGVCEDMINRFAILKTYPNGPEETTILPLGPQVVYQQMGDMYRKLIYYPENDYVRNYNFLPMNTLITNFENKRITMTRQYMPKNKLFVPIEDKYIGLIKYNFISKNMRMADAVFKTLYRDDMTNEQVTKLGIMAYNLQEGLPKDDKLIKANFNKFVNRGSLKSIL